MDPTNRIKHLLQPNGTPPLPDSMPQTALEEKQRLLAHYVRLVAKGHSNGLFVAGAGGLGKSHTIAATLASEGVRPVIINSHITPLSLYQTLYYNRAGDVIWLDDCDSAFRNLQILGLLRSALWGQGTRIVTYTSTQLPDDLPARFAFDSRIIFCANVIPARNEAFKAVLTRVDCFELAATNEEVLEQMRYLAGRGFETMTPEQCREVVAFIDQAGGNRRLSMRLYEPSLRKYLYAHASSVDWKELVRCQLDQLGGGENIAKPIDSKAHDLDCFKEAVHQFPQSVKDQEALWRKATGKSRASFYRLKRSIEKEEGK